MYRRGAHREPTQFTTICAMALAAEEAPALAVSLGDVSRVRGPDATETKVSAGGRPEALARVAVSAK
jgi:hypothetical protein